MLPQWVIVSDAGFFDGRRWVDEYPDAARYTNLPGALRAARTLYRQFPGCGKIYVVSDYGLITERKVRV